MTSSLNRRTFLLGGGATALSLAHPRRGRAAAANDEVRFGIIGCGVRGRSFASVATSVCDPDQERLASMAKSVGIKSGRAVTDLRRILDDPDIDAVIVATPDHWHAPAAILACEAGKHVYVEKPASHNFRESQLLLRQAERAGVVVQHGTQQRSRPFTRDAIARLHDGVIGDVLVAKAWNIQHRGGIGKHAPSQPPAKLDYDTWVGPAEWMPFQENRLHSDWHWWYNFGTGDIGNDGAHELDYARWGLAVDTLPHQIHAAGGKYFYNDDQQFPDTANCTFSFEQDGVSKQLLFEMRLWSRNYPLNCDSGVEFYGTEGQMFLSKRGKLEIRDAENQVIAKSRPGEENRHAHVDNFVESIRGNAEPNAPLIEAHRSVGLIHLANASLRAGRSLHLDIEREQIVGDSQANELLGRRYREEGHWSVPRGTA